MLFESMVWPILQLPGMLSKLAEARTSLIRVNKFLRRQDIEKVAELNDNDTLITMQGAEFEWTDEELLDEEEEEGKEGGEKKKKNKKTGKEEEEEGVTEVRVIGGSDILMEELDGDEEGPKDGDVEENRTHTNAEKEAEPVFLLQDLNFEIHDGELVAVIGHVGSG